MSTSQVGVIITHFVGAIGDALTTNIPVVLAVTASLIGLGFILSRVKRWIARKA